MVCKLADDRCDASLNWGSWYECHGTCFDPARLTSQARKIISGLLHSVSRAIRASSTCQTASIALHAHPQLQSSQSRSHVRLSPHCAWQFVPLTDSTITPEQACISNLSLRPFAASATFEAMTENQKIRAAAFRGSLNWRSSPVAVTTVPRCPDRGFCSTESRNRPLLQSWLPRPERSNRWSGAREGPETGPAVQGSSTFSQSTATDSHEETRTHDPRDIHRPKDGPAHRRPH